MPHRVIVAVIALLGLIGPAGPAPSAAQILPSRPNVVVIMTDDQTLEQMRVMSHTKSLIGAAGATFTNALVSFPLCCPSRATYLTGQYAHNHGVLENDAPTGGYYRLDSSNTLPVWLRKAGYRTIHVGKYLNAYGTKDPTEVPPGYDEWIGLVDPTTYWMWGYTLNENGALRTYGDPDVEDPALYQTDVLRDKAVDAIRRAADSGEPFYLNLWTLAPHREAEGVSAQFPPRSAPRHRGVFANEPMPRTASFNEADMSDKPLYMQVKPSMDAAKIASIEERYRAEIESLLAVDEAVKAVVDTLATEGILDDTYVIYTSDNGFMHGQHRTPVEKLVPYEPSIRVPLMVRGPGIAPGTVVDELAINTDLAPTIAQWAGATPGLTVDGRSFDGYLRGIAARTTRPALLELFWPVGSMMTFFSEQLPDMPGPAASSRGAGAPPAINAPLEQMIFPYSAIHTGRYVYIEYPTGERELYDLAVDPDQLGSLHLDPRYARTAVALHLHLQLLRACSGDGCRAETGPIPDP